MVGGAPGKVVQGVLHFTVTIICKHGPVSTLKIIPDLIGVCTLSLFASIKTQVYHSFLNAIIVNEYNEMDNVI